MSETATENTLDKPFSGVEQLGSLADLAAKYGQTVPQRPVPLGKEPAPKTEVTPESTDKPEGETDTVIKPPAEDKKEPFIPTLVEENKTLKAQAEELSKKLEKYEKEDVPSLNTRIQELEQKANDTDSKKEAEKYQKEIEQIQGILTQKDGELSEAKKRLQLLDLPNDPDFKAKYEAPVNAAYNRTRLVLGPNNVHQLELQKAHAAVVAASKTQDPQEKERQMTFALETMNGINEQLSPVQQNQFQQGFWELVQKTEDYTGALIQHESTAKQINEFRTRAQQEEAIKVKQRWNTGYRENLQKVTEETKYPEDVARIISSNKIDDITAEDEAVAVAAFDPDAPQYPPETLTRLLAQGAQYKKLKAQVDAYKVIIKEYEDTITKQRGSGTSGSSASVVTEKKPEEQAKTPATFQQMWE